jgi:arsenate reductase (thioredoxin)
MKPTLHPTLASSIDKLDISSLAEERKKLLQPLINYIISKREQNSPINLNFICTHNSRRSQFTQVWAQAAAYYYGIDINSFSGGVEVTDCNERTIAALERAGFQVSSQGKENPKYEVSFAKEGARLTLFSKLYDDEVNPKEEFAAVMTCDHADANCPFIPGTEARIPLLYEDPKAYDDTAQEAEKYNERNTQIATELFYVFSKIK